MPHISTTVAIDATPEANAFGQSLASLRRWIEKHQRRNSA